MAPNHQMGFIMSYKYLFDVFFCWIDCLRFIDLALLAHATAERVGVGHSSTSAWPQLYANEPLPAPTRLNGTASLYYNLFIEN